MPSDALLVRGNTLTFHGKSYTCAVGRGGIIGAEKKREGDGCTPAGAWVLRECWYRADRLDAPKTALPLRVIQHNDGWCDDAAHALYNKHFVIPSAVEESFHSPSSKDPSTRIRSLGMTTFEHLWLEDVVYDLIVPLGYNDDPVVPCKGSAIFLHVARPDYAPTEGCVALKKEDLLEVLAGAAAATVLNISQAPQ